MYGIQGSRETASALLNITIREKQISAATVGHSSMENSRNLLFGSPSDLCGNHAVAGTSSVVSVCVCSTY